MAEIHWLHSISGSFTNAADWSGGVVPGAGDDAILDASGTTPYKVSATAGESVNSIQTASNATLAVFGSVFNAFDGTGTGVNAGTISLSNGAALRVAGTFNNTGSVTLNNTGGAISFEVGAGSGLTLTGGGTVTMSNNVGNFITGGVPGVTETLTNANNTISGAGFIGSSGTSGMVLINQAAGVIDATGTNAMTIDASAGPVTNAGLIEATGAGGIEFQKGTISNSGTIEELGAGGIKFVKATPVVNTGQIIAAGAGGIVIQTSVANTGVLEAQGGVLSVKGAVSGNGQGVIVSGTLDFGRTFKENVAFTGTTGVLELAKSQSYTGAISGFATSGGTSLDLRDIGFVSSTEATFSGTATSGVLTVTDGTHTAHISLIGDYMNSTFVASGDGNGGTTVVDPANGGAAMAHRFIAAAAGLGGVAAGSMSVLHDGGREHPPMLAKPGTTIA